MSTTKRSAIFIPLLAVVVAAGAGVWVSRETLRRNPAVQLQHGTALSPAQALPDFSLVGEDGHAISKAQLQGQWTLVFFGFTHCPDVCPTTLVKLADVRKRLADLPGASQPHVVLVSVDPERDTPPVLAEYVKGFDPSFRGITGSVADVDAFAAALGVAHRKIEMGGDQYMVDHTAVVMLIDPQGRRSAIFSPPLDSAGIANDVRRVVTGTR